MAGPCLKQEPVLALPIFPGRRQPSIVGRNELNYRVRNGNGWTLALISTNLLVADFVSLASAFRPKLTLSVPPRLPRQTLRWFGFGVEVTSFYVIRSCRRTNCIILYSVPLVKPLFLRSRACFSRAPIEAQRSWFDGTGEKLPPQLRSRTVRRGFVPSGNFELVTRTGFEPMLTA